MTFAVVIATLVLVAGCAAEPITPSPEADADRLAAHTARSASLTAEAFFTSDDECLETYGWLTATEYGAQGGAGASGPRTVVDLNLQQLDLCDPSSPYGRPLIGISATTVLGHRGFTVRGDLSSATLGAEIAGFDFRYHSEVQIRLDVTWTGSGQLEATKEHQRTEWDGHSYAYRIESRERAAAVQARITIDGSADAIVMTTPGQLRSRRTHWLHVPPPPRPTPPVIHYFTASGYGSVQPGGSATLWWYVTGTEPITLTIDGGVGDVSGLDSTTVTPSETTTYTLTATGRHGSDTASVTVELQPPPGPDAFEDNGTMATAWSIDLSRFESFHAPGLTLTRGDVDWFVFTVDEDDSELGARVIGTGYGGPMDPIMAVVDAGGDVLAFADDVYGLDPFLRHPLDAGTYYLVIGGSPDTTFIGAHAQIGTYELHVWLQAPTPPDRYEPNDEAARAYQVTPDFVSSDARLEIGDVDWYSFDLDEDTVIAVGVETWGPPMLRLVLLDADLGRIVETHWSFERSLSAGRYYLVVTGSFDYDLTGGHIEEGPYVLSITSPVLPGSDLWEVNDSPTEARQVQPGVSTPTLTLTPGDVDWFWFVVDEPSNVLAWISCLERCDTFHALVFVFDDRLEPIYVSWPYSWATLGAGTYFLAVSAYPDFGPTGDHETYASYSLELFIDPAP